MVQPSKALKQHTPAQTAHAPGHASKNDKGSSSSSSQHYQVGDTVHVERWWRDEDHVAQSRFGLPHVAIVTELYKEEGVAMCRLRYFYRPHQTFHPPRHRFHLKEVLLSGHTAYLPTSELGRRAAVLGLTEYRRSQAVGVPEQDNYVCTSVYYPDAKSISPLGATTKGKWTVPALEALPDHHSRCLELFVCGDTPIVDGRGEGERLSIQYQGRTHAVVFVADMDVPVHMACTAPYFRTPVTSPAKPLTSLDPTRRVVPRGCGYGLTCMQVSARSNAGVRGARVARG